MKCWNRNKEIALGMIALLANAAQAGVVYDDQVYSAYENQVTQERETLRNVMETSNKAQVSQATSGTTAVELPVVAVPAPAPLIPAQTVAAPVAPAPATVAPATSAAAPQPVVYAQAPAPAPAPAQVIAPTIVAPVTAPAVSSSSNNNNSTSSDVEHVSQSEMVRRERVRQEVKNEDMLQVRLEELRLRDEKARMDKILNTEEPVPAQTVAPVAATQQMVVAPPTEATAVVVSPQDQVVQTQAAAVPASVIDQVTDAKSSTVLSVVPRFGLSGVTGTSLSVSPRFTTGLGLGVEASEYLTINMGYQYSEYGVSIMSTDPYIAWMQNQGGYMNGNYEILAMKQNVFELGVKVYLLDRKSTFRPFIGGGGAYAKSFINFDQNAFQFYQPYYGYGANVNNNFGPDYELSQFLAYISGGFDIKVSKAVSLGFTGSFYKVLSSRENHPIPTPYFVNPNTWYNQYWAPQYGGNPGSFDKNYVGASLARTNFYTLLGTVSFSF